MRCARVEKLVDRYVDGALSSAMARAVAEHEGRCLRCAAKVRAARAIAAALAEARPLRAPEGLLEGVMGAVYREALAGSRDGESRREAAGPEASRREAAVAAGSQAASWPAGLSRVYRRLGLCFMLSAAVLVASLVVPRAFYPLQPEAVRDCLAPQGASVVKEALSGAGRAVSGLLYSRGGVDR